MSRPTRYLLRLTAAGATLALVAVAAHTALASNSGPGGGGDGGGGGGGTLAPTKVTVINQVANTTGNGLITDADVKNPWGLALGPSGGALWVANNNSNNSTLYQGGLNGAAVTKSTLTVAIPGGKPTGQAFSGGTDFVVTGSGGGSGPARFIFSSDQGDITAWNPTADRTNAILMAHVNGAVYRGLTFLATANGNFLLANDFRNNRIDMFDSSFHKVTLAAGQFADRNIPSGFAPFNVQAIGSSVYVAYARQGSSGGSDAGSDAGYVDVFTNNGMTVSRIVSASGARAPWGLAVAPSTWGAIAGDLLVGSFHDGFIYVYQGTRFVGQLATTNNSAVRIQRLWALTPGNPQNGGTGTIWFSAGPEDGQNGIVGELTPA